jgi:hypothetical protein
VLDRQSLHIESIGSSILVEHDLFRKLFGIMLLVRFDLDHCVDAEHWLDGLELNSAA